MVKKEGGVSGDGAKGAKRGMARGRPGAAATQQTHEDSSDEDHELRTGKYTETSSVY